MKSLSLFLCPIVVATTLPGRTYGYEVQTHVDLAKAAVNESVLRFAAMLRDSLGLDKSSDDSSQTFPNSKGVKRTIEQLIQDGASFEDNVSIFSLSPEVRVTKHFYDPFTGTGLRHPLLGEVSSPDWAIEDRQSDSRQKFSYRDARQAHLDGLIKSTEVDRQTALGLAFQSLGHVIHHVQDMAQPQHVRNDLHCDRPVCAPFGAYAPSGYEEYSNLPSSRNKITSLSIPEGYDLLNQRFLSAFNVPRKFWHTEAPGPNSPVLGKGLAEFTQRNFVSAGTNFASSAAGFGPNRDFPLPVPTSTPSNVEVVDVASLPGVSGLRGQLWFVKSQVVDNYTGAPPVDNLRAATYSIFDNDLQRVNPGFGRLFSLNRFNYDEAHKFLIPRAVAYSAGLINYFFRGKLDYVDDPQLPGVNRIRNLSNETMKGTFAFYYDAPDGTRSPVPNARWEGITLPPYNASITNPADPAYGFAVAFNPPTDPALGVL